MGSLSKLINDLDGASADEKAQKERLEMLLALAKSKIDKFRTDLDEGFANPGLINKTQIPGTRAIRYVEQYHVASKTEFNQQVGDHLDHAIDAFFSIGEGKNKAAVQEGLKQVIQTGLSAFIGSTEVGETQDRMYFVVPENNAFVRIDVVCWKYHFDQSKVLDQHDTAVAYVLCKSVIDHTQITLDELIYLVTQALSTGTFMNDKVLKGDVAAPADKANLSAALAKLDIDADSDVGRYLATDGVISYSNAPVTIKRALIDNTSHQVDKRTLTWDQFATRILSHDLPAVVTKVEPKLTEQGAVDGTATVSNKYLRFKGLLDIAGVPLVANPAALTVVEAYIDEMVRVWKKLSTDR